MIKVTFFRLCLLQYQVLLRDDVRKTKFQAKSDLLADADCPVFGNFSLVWHIYRLCWRRNWCRFQYLHLSRHHSKRLCPIGSSLKPIASAIPMFDRRSEFYQGVDVPADISTRCRWIDKWFQLHSTFLNSFPDVLFYSDQFFEKFPQRSVLKIEINGHRFEHINHSDRLTQTPVHSSPARTYTVLVLCLLFDKALVSISILPKSCKFIFIEQWSTMISFLPRSLLLRKYSW